VGALDGDARPDGDEIVEVRWFTRPSLIAAVTSGEVTLPPSISIARRLIEGWVGQPLPDGTW
jgi:NAD+ diphosphatase